VTRHVTLATGGMPCGAGRLVSGVQNLWGLTRRLVVDLGRVTADR
jgi:hypothetical protein